MPQALTWVLFVIPAELTCMIAYVFSVVLFALPPGRTRTVLLLRISPVLTTPLEMLMSAILDRSSFLGSGMYL